MRRREEPADVLRLSRGCSLEYRAGRPSSSGSRSASTAVLSGSRGGCCSSFCAGWLTPERCVEAYYLQRTRFESIAERKLRGRQLTEDGNVGATR
jgi:hypothetical protein